MTEPLFINENMKVDDVIRKMQSSQKHMAIVLDEHGGTSGIVTMEDCIEEMVGEIYDEHDDEVKEYVDKKNDHEYVVDPDMNVKDLFEMLEIEHMPDTEYNSVGGFLFNLSEELPEEGKVIVFKTVDERVKDGVYISVLVEIHFTLTKVEDNRIKEIFVKVIDVGEANNNQENETSDNVEKNQIDNSEKKEKENKKEKKDSAKKKDEA